MSNATARGEEETRSHSDLASAAKMENSNKKKSNSINKVSLKITVRVFRSHMGHNDSEG